jgi:high-affinity iron transporter
LLPTLFLPLAALFLLLAPAAPAGEEGAGAALALLDYIAADYPEAVEDGRVLDPEEYAEMQEFAARVAGLLDALPGREGRDGVLALGASLDAAIDSRAPPRRVAALASDLRAALLSVYRPVVTPAEIDSRERAAGLYAEQCASCHGATGSGDGPAAAALIPPPTAFIDTARASERSVYGYFSTITAGVDGTAMTSYARLDAAERWALAFYVASLADGEDLRERGAALHAAGADAGPAGLQSLVTATAAGLPDADARAAYAWLKAHPEALLAAPESALQKASQLIAESLDAYRAGDAAGASRLALSAYLDGFEHAEEPLSAVDEGLTRDIERAMKAYRGLLEQRGAERAVAVQAGIIRERLAQAGERLSR